MWQPIETAPRDRKFLGFRPAAPRAFDTYLISVCKYRMSTGGKLLLYSEADYDGIPYHDWTHWQPLPPPPTTPAGG
jgi:hypothetical protein